jgi:hypothetical protein
MGSPTTLVADRNLTAATQQCLALETPCRRRLAEVAARSAAERAQEDAVVREAMRKAAEAEAREAEAKARRRAEAISYR